MALVYSFCVLGSKPAMMPNKGKTALILKIKSMLVISASQPKKAEPNPPKPNIRPKNTPDMRPTLSGIRSVA